MQQRNICIFNEKGDSMKYIELCGMKLSSVALGTDVYGTYLEEKESYLLLDMYASMGGNLIDTANIYGFKTDGDSGYSERLIGRWLKGKRREDFYISTKGGHPNPVTMNISRLSREEIEADMNESLERLGTDYIDIYWLHRDDEALPVCDIAETLNELVKCGKTRYIGMSNWTYKRIAEFNRYARENNLTELIASQIQFSPAVANIENNEPTLVLMNKDEYKYFKDEKLAVFGYASQAKGFFSKFLSGGESALSEKARDRYFNDKTIDVYNILKRVSQELGRTIGETVISAMISNPDFPCIPIIGCKNTDQLKDSLGGCDFKPGYDDIKEIFKYYNGEF